MGVDHHRMTLRPIITLRIGADHQITTQMGDWCWPPNHNTENGWCQQMITLRIQPQDTHPATQHHHQHKILVRFSILIQLSAYLSLFSILVILLLHNLKLLLGLLLLNLYFSTLIWSSQATGAKSILNHADPSLMLLLPSLNHHPPQSSSSLQLISSATTSPHPTTSEVVMGHIESIIILICYVVIHKCSITIFSCPLQHLLVCFCPFLEMPKVTSTVNVRNPCYLMICNSWFILFFLNHLEAGAPWTIRGWYFGPSCTTHHTPHKRHHPSALPHSANAVVPQPSPLVFAPISISCHCC